MGGKDLYFCGWIFQITFNVKSSDQSTELKGKFHPSEPNPNKDISPGKKSRKYCNKNYKRSFPIVFAALCDQMFESWQFTWFYLAASQFTRVLQEIYLLYSFFQFSSFFLLVLYNREKTSNANKSLKFASQWHITSAFGCIYDL